MPSRASPTPTAATVVVVDDHAGVRQATTRLLEDAGITVLATADTVARGLSEVLRVRPHVAVVDNRLPDGQGVDLCRAIRSAAPGVVVVVHSNGPGGDSARDAGAAEFVVKSAFGEALVEAVLRQAPTGRQAAPPAAAE